MAKKKVLIITYYWPPAGGPGVQRWLKFTKYLPEFGIEPVVYCPSNPYYPIIDNSLQEEIHKEISIIKQPISEPYDLAKLFSKKETTSISSGIIPVKEKQSSFQKILLYIRGNFFIPDARKDWVKPSIKYLTNYINENAIETVITTGPPHSLHLIGLGLKEKRAIKWIADFRDPWTTIGYHKLLKLSPNSKAKHLRLENEVLNKADQIVVTSNHTKREFEVKTNKPISVITNGYDDHNVSIDQKDKFFTISHIGSLLSDRNPLMLWEVLKELMIENTEFAQLFRLQLVGVVSEDVVSSINKSQLQDHLNVIGYVNHEDAIKYQLKSQVLLLIEIDSEDTKAIIPGKLFEYLISGTPILAIGPQGSDIEDIIIKTNTGRYFNYHQREALKSHVLQLFEAFKTSSLTVEPIGLNPYSRKELTRKLASLI